MKGGHPLPVVWALMEFPFPAHQNPGRVQGRTLLFIFFQNKVEAASLSSQG